MRCIENKGVKVAADISSYKNPKSPQFILADVFRNVHMNVCTEKQLYTLKENCIKNELTHNFLMYREPNNCEVAYKKANLALLDITGGIISGSFQSCYYAENISEILTNEFEFDYENIKDLKKVADIIKENNSIGVHIRRGDYLGGSNRWKYGDICTNEYYHKAIEYITKYNSDNILVFFSNDIEWVKKEYCYENSIYINEDMFEDYKDWYDMYLMSICRHNVIANSTFSWWGAWLNHNKDKIVVAPKKWVNQCEYIDIYPEEWIVIDEMGGKTNRGK
jgi:hypothetical protein